jgi:hypothetical protein
MKKSDFSDKIKKNFPVISYDFPNVSKMFTIAVNSVRWSYCLQRTIKSKTG